MSRAGIDPIRGRMLADELSVVLDRALARLDAEVPQLPGELRSACLDSLHMLERHLDGHTYEASDLRQAVAVLSNLFDRADQAEPYRAKFWDYVVQPLRSLLTDLRSSMWWSPDTQCGELVSARVDDALLFMTSLSRVDTVKHNDRTTVSARLLAAGHALTVGYDEDFVIAAIIATTTESDFAGRVIRDRFGTSVAELLESLSVPVTRLSPTALEFRVVVLLGAARVQLAHAATGTVDSERLQAIVLDTQLISQRRAVLDPRTYLILEDLHEILIAIG